MTVTGAALIAERYRLIRQLGEGGMGRVWLARDEVLSRDVAIKEVVPPPGLTEEERAATRERSLREARAIARLNHPSVVRIYDVVQQEQWPWIVMEYVPSRSLDEVIRADGPLPVPEAARIGAQMLAALRAAHRIGMLHRDVKPANVLLADDGRVVLTDFGLATVEGDPSVTRSGLILGSPAYIAPERARDGVSLPESDLWSLGATIYAAVEGKSPYARSSAMATLSALASEEPDPAPHAGALRPLLTGLLRKDPAARITADRAAELLHHVMAGRAPDSRFSRLFGLPRQRRSAEDTPDSGTGAAAGAALAGAAAPSTPDTGAGGGTGPGAEGPGENRNTRVLPAGTRPDPAIRGVAVPAGRPASWPGEDDRTVLAGAGTSRRKVLTGVGAAVLALVLIGVAVLLTRGTADRATKADPSASAGRTGGAAPGDPGASGSAGSSAAPKSPTTPSGTQQQPGGNTSPSGGARPGSGQGANFTLPANWRWYTDPTGFKIAVPNGWTSDRPANYPQMIYFRSPSGGLVVGIDQSQPGVAPKPDPKADWEQQEDARVARGDFPDYQRIKLDYVEYRDYRTVDWEFTYTSNGVRTHAVNRNMVTSPTKAYAVWWSTPDSTWKENYRYFQAMMDSFQPKG